MKRHLLSGVVLFTFFALILYGVWRWGYHAGQHAKATIATDTVTIEKMVKEPYHYQERQVGTLKVPASSSNIANTGAESSDTCATQLVDSVVLPITQREYRDSNFTAWVSGVKPQLDSIVVRQRIITRTVPSPAKKARRWNVGITGGYGIGLQTGHAEPFVGIGVNFNLLK